MRVYTVLMGTNDYLNSLDDLEGIFNVLMEYDYTVNGGSETITNQIAGEWWALGFTPSQVRSAIDAGYVWADSALNAGFAQE